jgi:hypothetical protein
LFRIAAAIIRRKGNHFSSIEAERSGGLYPPIDTVSDKIFIILTINLLQNNFSFYLFITKQTHIFAAG